MTLVREVPGVGRFEIEYLLLDLNGTVTTWGEADDGLSVRLHQLGEHLEIHLLSADTHGTLSQTANSLGTTSRVVRDGHDKRAAVEEFGAERCVAIGNGANDAAMLEAASVGIAVVGGEGLATSALRAADVLCGSLVEAMDLLLETSGLAATLRN